MADPPQTQAAPIPVPVPVPVPTTTSVPVRTVATPPGGGGGEQKHTTQPPQPPQPLWATDPQAYQLIGKIGQGAFAVVWKAKQIDNGKECAVKVLNLDHVDSNLSEIRLEVQAMRLSSHPNILCCHSAFCKETDLWLVTQLMRKGSSLHCLQGARRTLQQQQQQHQQQDSNSRMEDHILYILHETLLGLQYIHDNGQIHRDIKAGNILLDGNGDVRIADFGVSGWLINAGSQQEKAKTFVGTPCWMAPEVMEQIHGYDYKADIWSLGITALELAKGYAPYAKYPPMKVLILTIQEDPPSLDTYDEEDENDQLFQYHTNEEFSKNFSALVDTCLQKNPAKRPKSLELLQSKYLVAMQQESYRQERREAMRTQVCDLIVNVGDKPNYPNPTAAASASSSSSQAFPGNSPVSIITSKDENRPAGTTWVFADGSQVLASSTNEESELDDVMQELDQFGMQTGGEHYDTSRGPGQAPPAAAESAVPLPPPSVTASGSGGGEEEEESDELAAFMDEFELNTQGENFRRD
jgi:serine/threonine-protein kinase OSR1/STK39